MAGFVSAMAKKNRRQRRRAADLAAREQRAYLRGVASERDKLTRVVAAGDLDVWLTPRPEQFYVVVARPTRLDPIGMRDPRDNMPTATFEAVPMALPMRNGLGEPAWSVRWCAWRQVS